MANQNHLAVLKKGVAAWNDWREKNPEIQPDLSRANLYVANLSAADLIEADLRGADLHGGRPPRGGPQRSEFERSEKPETGTGRESTFR